MRRPGFRLRHHPHIHSHKKRYQGADHSTACNGYSDENCVGYASVYEHAHAYAYRTVKHAVADYVGGPDCDANQNAARNEYGDSYRNGHAHDRE